MVNYWPFTNIKILSRCIINSYLLKSGFVVFFMRFKIFIHLIHEGFESSLEGTLVISIDVVSRWKERLGILQITIFIPLVFSIFPFVFQRVQGGSRYRDVSCINDKRKYKTQIVYQVLLQLLLTGRTFVIFQFCCHSNIGPITGTFSASPNSGNLFQRS